MGKPKHTPMPWKVLNLTPKPQPVAIGYSENVGAIAYMCQTMLNDDMEANAAFICRAVNSHDALVEALESALCGLANPDAHPQAQQARIKKAQAALALANATGQQSEEA